MKPNPQRVPHKCDGDIVLDQLKLSGAFETVKIRQNEFLIRQPCVDFVKRYLMIIKSTAAPVMYNIESGVQDLELEFVAYDAGSIAMAERSLRSHLPLSRRRRECEGFVFPVLFLELSGLGALRLRSLG